MDFGTIAVEASSQQKTKEDVNLTAKPKKIKGKTY